MKYGLYCTEDITHYEAFNKVTKEKVTITPNHSFLNHTSSLTRLKAIKLLHLRYGQIPFSRLTLLYPGLKISCTQEDLICIICPIARQHRLPFSHSDIKTHATFELLHVDLWGPYTNATRSGCKMFLIVVDDFTRTTWLYLLKNKDQCAHIFNGLFS